VIHNLYAAGAAPLLCGAPASAVVDTTTREGGQDPRWRRGLRSTTTLPCRHLHAGPMHQAQHPARISCHAPRIPPVEPGQCLRSPLHCRLVSSRWLAYWLRLWR